MIISYINYKYKVKRKLNGNKLISIRDIPENCLLEIEEKKTEIKITINMRNERYAAFNMPTSLFNKIKEDIKKDLL